MGGAAKRGDYAATEAHATSALAIAEAEKWFELAGVVHFFLGSLLLQLGRATDAYRRFIATDEAGQKSEAAGASGGKRMRLQGRMAAGSALLSVGAHPQAARIFTETVPVARAAEDKRAELDCFRLASYAHEQSNNLQEAWDAGIQGFKVAREMDDDTRKTSTVRHLGESLLRMTERSTLRDYGPTMRRELAAMLGADWQP
jgi:hypothetical protein